MAERFGVFFWTKADYDAVMVKLDRILANQAKILANQLKPSKQEEAIMSALDDLIVQVKENTDLEKSGVQLIQGIAAQLQEALNAGDNPAIASLTQQLQTSAAALSAAIAANTQVTPAT